jgi:hypothetical protein
MNRLKKFAIWVIAGLAFYFVLSHHFILIGNGIKILRKSRLTLDYTIFSAKGKKIESIIAVDELRKDGIGELLVEAGLISEDELVLLLEKYEE